MSKNTPPQLSLITGDGLPLKGINETWGYYTHDLGYDFVCLLNFKTWNPDESPYANDITRSQVEIDGKKIWVVLSNVSQRDDYFAERKRNYLQSFCVIVLYSAMSKASLEDAKCKIEEIKQVASEVGPTPPIVIIGTRYHRKSEEIEVPFTTAKDYAASIGVKIYQTFGQDRAKEALDVMSDIVKPFLDAGLLVADKDLDASLKHASKAFHSRFQTEPNLIKKSRCIIQ